MYNKKQKKLNQTQLEELLIMRSRTSIVPPKKGKGSFKRKNRNNSNGYNYK